MSVDDESFEQRRMRREAEKQAQDRADRTGETCYVYRVKGSEEKPIWYVRTKEEGVPVAGEGATLEYTAFRG